MALVALLSARTAARDGVYATPPALLIDFGGQSLIAYQMRLCAGAGTEKILIQIDAPTPELAAITDQIADEYGCSVSLIQGMAGLGRAIAPQDTVLLLPEGVVIAQEALDTLAMRQGEAMLTVPSIPATAAFERIDAQEMWAGGLTVSGERVLTTLDMLGEWDLALTLLRRAVQDGAPRIALSADLVADARIALVHDQASADVALAALTERSFLAATEEQSGGIARVLAPLTRGLVRKLVRRQINPAQILLGAMVLSAGALACAIMGWMLAAVLIMLPALGVAKVGEQCAHVTLRATGRRWQTMLVQASGLLVLAILGLRLSEGNILAMLGAWIPLVFIALLTFASDRVAVLGDWYAQAEPGIAGALLLLLIGFLVGWPALAFALLGVVMTGSIGLRLIRSPELKV